MTHTASNATEQVTIESIRIERAPGIDGAFALPEIGAGIVIIHGPNGSGKSTTARAIHSLLWPEPQDDGCSVTATLRHAGYLWSLRRDGRTVRCERDGEVHPRLSFSHLGPGNRDRYHLALHDLLDAADEHFASLVTREASGGFDLESAAVLLGFDRPPSASSASRLAGEVRDRRGEHKAIVQKQAALSDVESPLAALERESERAKQAGLEISWLTALRHALDARAELVEAEAALSRFDPAMRHVQGTDAALIAGWQADEPLLREKLRELDAAIERERRTLADTGLAPDADCVKQIHLLEGLRDELIRVERDLGDLAVALEPERTRLSQLHASIAPLLPESLQAEEAVTLLRTYVDALTRQEEAAQIAAAEALLAAWIPQPEAVPDLDQIQKGLWDLTAWLQTPPPAEQDPTTPRLRLYALIAAAVVIVQGILLGQALHPAAYASALIGLAIGALALTAKPLPAAVDRRVLIAENFQRLGLDEPESWTAEDVAAELQALVLSLQSGRASRIQADLWKTLTPKLSERADAIDAAQAKRAAIEEQTGVALQLDRHALAALVARLDQWVEASAACARLNHRRELFDTMREGHLHQFNESSVGLGCEAVTSGNEARASVALLRGRFDRAQRAQSSLDAAMAERDGRVRPALDRIERAREALIERFSGLPIDAITSLASQFEEYQQARQTVANRADQLRSRAAALDASLDLDAWTIEQVQARIADEQAIADRATDLNQRIGGIKTEIELAKANDDISAALARLDAARDQLRERRDDHLIKTVGGLLLEEVRRETREANLPDVAKRARRLFADITHGRYELLFHPGVKPSFAARDQTTGLVQTLDQLSSATRVQLLIAVRMAFVETNEQGTRLPVIFDETLANADAARAEALIEATCELSRSGRQIFYFTAQLDEVEKWRQLAGERGMPIQVIDLGKARRLTTAARPALVTLDLVETSALPSPNGYTRAAYRRIIGAPPLNLWSVDGGDIHLWHLIDDLDELHRLSAELRVTHWGQVRQLTINGESPALGLDRDCLACLTARADACWALIEAARIGRGRPVTSEDLYASNGMTDTFAERCLQLLEACGGDGRHFIERLENRAIPRFYEKNISIFRDYFEANGHIVSEAPLSAADIRVQVIRRLNDPLAGGLIDVQTIDRMISEAFTSVDPAEDATEEGAVLLSASR